MLDDTGNQKTEEQSIEFKSDLSEITKKALRGINVDIKRVQFTMDQSKQKVAEQLQTVEQTNQAFQEIAYSVMSITERTNHIVM
ncbi:hypothetical protein [Paenibacillus monticola]|uniref:Uncharacterized protein n=1 Tax=Paenibacillus monticola TaxID=2666075 RepID=A0A7X2H5K6_9BACL|nr:hypothetical protein [Paenibacillus monticola]MRN53957.1 hypothetical protein [Paenibacillus monticola]